MKLKKGDASQLLFFFLFPFILCGIALLIRYFEEF